MLLKAKRLRVNPSRSTLFMLFSVHEWQHSSKLQHIGDSSLHSLVFNHLHIPVVVLISLPKSSFTSMALASVVNP